MDYLLQPGEIQLLSNHTCLHTRSAFVDYDDVDQRRHLLRWVAGW
jgi:Taurine catabolism dioxygenase TauD, TfdA family